MWFWRNTQGGGGAPEKWIDIHWSEKESWTEKQNFGAQTYWLKNSDNPTLETLVKVKLDILVKKSILVILVKDVQGSPIGNWLGSKTVTLLKVFKQITYVLEVCKNHVGLKLGLEWSQTHQTGGGGTAWNMSKNCLLPHKKLLPFLLLNFF